MSISRFLCRDESEQRRIADLGRRLRPGAPFVVGAFVVAGVSGVGAYGWLPLLPPAVALAAATGVWFLYPERRQHPERVHAAAFVFTEAMLALAILLAHGPKGSALAVLAMPVVLAAAILPRRVVFACICYGGAVMLITTFAADLPEVRSTPVVAYGALFVLASLAVTVLVLRDLDDASRRAAFVDELTGTLKRAALTPRVAELTHHAAASGQPVAVIVGDVDGFKAINDDFGHGAGDAVLREVARRLGECVNGFEPIYRLGGEEFVVLLPGRDARAAEEVAVRMWRAVREQPVEPASATMSFGVASSSDDEPFDFNAVFARADRALYVAKRNGRDQVQVALEPGVPATGAIDRLRPLQEVGSGARPPERGTLGRRRKQSSRRGRPHRPHAARDRSAEAQPHSTRGGRLIAGDRAVTEDLEREHVLDLMQRLGPLYAGLSLTAFVVIASAIPWFGWHALIPPVLAAVPLYLLMRAAGRLRNTDRVLATGLFAFQTAIAAGFMLAHGAPLFALSLLILMVPGPAAVHSARTGAIFTAYTAVLMAAIAFKLDASQVVQNPSVLLFPIALLAECGYVGYVVGSSTVDFRGAGILDELTGLLNRTALATRFLELEAQTSAAPRRVAIVVADLDHFKQVNDVAGHAVGDVVLEEVAARFRACLRTFDSAYRIGGEEFLVLVPDAEAGEAVRLAERLWRAVRSAPCVGLDLTMSLGVAAGSSNGASFYEELFARADAALYEAKRAGRDRVCVDDGNGTAFVQAGRRAPQLAGVAGPRAAA